MSKVIFKTWDICQRKIKSCPKKNKIKTSPVKEVGHFGFIESLKDSNHLWDCFFFHDVDMLPEDLRNYYKCDYDLPVHYAAAVAKYNYE